MAGAVTLAPPAHAPASAPPVPLPRVRPPLPFPAIVNVPPPKPLIKETPATRRKAPATPSSLQPTTFVPSTRGQAGPRRASAARPAAAAAAAAAVTERARLRSEHPPPQPGAGGAAGQQAAQQAAQQQAQQQAQQELVDCNLPLVFHLANKYRGMGLPHQDLVGVGLLALQHAAARFNPAQGTQFSTYACTVIIRRMRQAAEQESDSPLMLPPNKWALLRREAAARRGLEATLGRPPTHQEVAEAVGVPARQLSELRRLMWVASFAPSQGPLSLAGSGSVASGSGRIPGVAGGAGGAGGAAISRGLQGGRRGSGDSEGLTLEDLASDEEQDADDADMLTRESTLRELLCYLPAQQRAAVELRFGLADNTERTVGEVAQALGVSKHRAQHMLGRALGTLRVLAQ